MINTVDNIRSSFINYFVKNGHTHVESSSLIPHNDPSLMFVNSGMVQFKNVFTGLEKRRYTTATSSQKCVRAGGKHNDLDNVGYTARHHTFFEMLGNFSFGDYFKEEAIYHAWTLLTKYFELPKDRLYVTVYHTDDEAITFWKKIAGLSDDRIIRIATNDNFWSMGDTGPCGPCSEIFYDHGEGIYGGLPGTKDQDGDRYIEIWNMVFMQFEQIDKDTRIELPAKSIDTGMGIERVAAVLQGMHDNYEIDIFKDIIAESEKLSGVQAEGDASSSHRVIADHLRSSSFLIADGVLPSNEGRGYVLRRIMRRAMRHAHHIGVDEPLLYRLSTKLVNLMGETYPELVRASGLIKNILFEEEKRFNTTIGRGIKLLSEESENIRVGGIFSGEVAFKLYDTYGFPLDLTEDILRKKDIKVDHDAFNQHMEEQRTRARTAWVGSGEAKTDALWFDIKSKYGATEFLGYSLDQAHGNILAIIHDGECISSFERSNNNKFILVTNQTPFYAESGGQMGDVGTIYNDKCQIRVTDTRKYLGGIHAHYCELIDGVVSLGQSVALEIDIEHRNGLKAHHSAAHILHAALRNIFGAHVTQKGSLVAHNRLRFDVSHSVAISAEEIRRIEDEVNKVILENVEVTTQLMPTESAINMGAMALFGEKYDDEVRVVSINMPKSFGGLSMSYSLELCGGTHVRRTGDIGMFKIISESAIAAGVRRIEAVAHNAFMQSVRDDELFLDNICITLKTPKNEILLKVDSILKSHKDLEKAYSNLQLGLLKVTPEKIANAESMPKGLRFLSVECDSMDMKSIRESIENACNLYNQLVIVYINHSDDEKIVVSVGVSNDIQSSIVASQLITKVIDDLADTVTLKGGGNKKIAQLSSCNKSYVSLILEALKNFLS